MDNANISTVTIPIPSQSQNNFGVHATTHHSSMRLMQRYNKEQHEVIRKQAERLGLTVSAFIKESAFNMAKALEHQEKQHAQHGIRSG